MNYLLTWNPERWHWATYDDDVGRAERGLVVSMNWATGNTKRVAPGDRLFLLRQGKVAPGIVGSGYATRRVFAGPHFDRERRAHGDVALFTSVRFDTLLPADDVLPLRTLKDDGALSAFHWTPAASGFQLPDVVAQRLESIWAQHLRKTRRGPPPQHESFRAAIEVALDARPLGTPEGVVRGARRIASFGSPGGMHDSVDAWVYERRGSPLVMWFGFYSNFTPNDLICKVMRAGDTPEPGVGASIQFNGDECVAFGRSSGYALTHHGRVTVGTAVSRQRLAEAMRSADESAAADLGIAGDTTWWPIRIGETDQIGPLLDRLFRYAYLVEQAKRELREEAPLPVLGVEPPEMGNAGGSLGFARDQQAKRAVELWAMERARGLLIEAGYEVEDHSGHAPYDLLAKRDGVDMCVEVKGTRGDGTSVILTSNEVEHARSKYPDTALIVVTGITYANGRASGGRVVPYWAWDPDQHALLAKSFRCDLDLGQADDPR